MITAGVDLSSQDVRTASCRIEWSVSGAKILDLSLGTSDVQIINLIQSADKVGVDVPLGWPMAFVEALAQHNSDGSWPSDYNHSDTLAVRYRRTDLAVWRIIKGNPPLSVSTDKIALPAMRSAAMLSRLPYRVALDGSGVVVEVYPAAALKRWGFESRGYKGRDNVQARQRLVTTFYDATTTWLGMTDEQLSLCAASDDAFDAVVCALVARASARLLCEPIGDEDWPAALIEGWIALPREHSLAQLAMD